MKRTASTTPDRDHAHLSRRSAALRLRRPLTLIAAALLVISGCAAQPSPKLVQELDRLRLDAPEHQSLRNTTIVDVHTHTFNARYLPIENILLGKRDESFATQFMSDWVAKGIAALLLSRTHLAPVETDPHMLLPAPTEPTVNQRLEKITGGNPQRIAEIKADPDYQEVQAMLQDSDRQGADSLLFDQPLHAFAFRPHSKLKGFAPFNNPGFLALMTRPDGPREDIYRSAYGIPDRRLFRVSLMMDLAPVFGQDPEPDKLLTIQEQIHRMSWFQEHSTGSMVYFVAYCPFRDNRDPGASLDIIKDAIENQHAYGVKLYPPSGYRPAANDIIPRPRTLNPAAEHQWDARYTDPSKPGNPQITNQELDSRLRALLEYCEDHDVPIMVHCNYNEFEPRVHYSRQMAGPEWWKTYLQESAKRGRGNLRLCFGHAGGPDFWSSHGDFTSWGKTVAELCCTYKNVYCEISIDDNIARSRDQATFVEAVSRLIASPSTPEHPYHFADKIMYGTDWFMPIDCSRRAYLEGYEKAFLLPTLRPYYKAFFRDNAINFLDARRRQSDLRLPAPVREKLRELVNEP